MGGQVKVKSRNSLKEGQRAVADCMYKTPTTGVLLIYLINYTIIIIYNSISILIVIVILIIVQ
jgi:hypothetical protein